MNVKRTTSSTALNRHHPGSAGASPVVSGASPETSDHIRYSKRRLPHFERAWAKYAVVFSTRDRHQLTEAERDIVLESILYASRHAQYELFVACVMPDHVHLLFEPQPKERSPEGKPTFWSLTEILHGIKSTTAHRINKARRATGTVWESECFDRLIRSERDLHEKFQYICRNPWQSNVVGADQEYPWLWTAEMGSAVAPNRTGEAPALPGSARSRLNVNRAN
jgi:putative transposase